MYSGRYVITNPFSVSCQYLQVIISIKPRKGKHTTKVVLTRVLSSSQNIQPHRSIASLYLLSQDSSLYMAIFKRETEMGEVLGIFNFVVQVGLEA